MAVACGHSFTVLVTEKGNVWAFGSGDAGQLGLGNYSHSPLPALVGGCEVFGEKVVMMAAGQDHTACVTKDGAIWSWGCSFRGELGHGDDEPRQRPTRLGREMFGGSPAVMISCGKYHTIVLTEEGWVWTCGAGENGRLGHGNEDDRFVLTRVAGERFLNTQIVMVAAASHHSVALGVDAKVWCWGKAIRGRVGAWDSQDERFSPSVLHPTQVGKNSTEEAAFGGTTPVMIAAGYNHTLVITNIGRPWAWGMGNDGQLGSGDRAHRYLPQRVGTEDAFGNSQVIMASGGSGFTLFVTEEGRLWSCGSVNEASDNYFSSLGNNTLLPFCIEGLHFGNTKITSAAGGSCHAVAVNEHGCIFTWGTQTSFYIDVPEDGIPDENNQYFNPRPYPRGVGHDIAQNGHLHTETMYVVTPLVVDSFHGERVGRCHRLTRENALAFAMSTHARLGSGHTMVTVARDDSKLILMLKENMDLKFLFGPCNAQSLHDDGKFLQEVLPYNFLFISVHQLNIVERVWNFYPHMCMHKEFL
jgi:alpha-tubulin suppressor-like RCC1 family protein